MAVPTPISGLPSATPASGDLAVIVHSGVTSKTTLGDILDLVNVPVTSVAGRTGAVVLVSTDITDSTAIGRAVLTALDAASARTAIGAGVGNALTSGTLGQFAATTSAQLAGVLTDETGSGGGFVRAESPTITTPIVSGTLTVRQAGGTAGTDEVRIYHDGSEAVIRGHDGPLVDVSATGVHAFRRGDAPTFDIVQILSTAGVGGLSVGYGGAVAIRSGAPGNLSSGNQAFFFQNTLQLNSTGFIAFTGTSDANVTASVTLSRNADGVAQIGTTAANALGSLRLTNLTASGLTTLGTYTVGTLPSASANAGALAQVTDSNTTTNGATVAGGGANRVPVYSNGTNWIVK